MNMDLSQKLKCMKKRTWRDTIQWAMNTTMRMCLRVLLKTKSTTGSLKGNERIRKVKLINSCDIFTNDFVYIPKTERCMEFN